MVAFVQIFFCGEGNQLSEAYTRGAGCRDLPPSPNGAHSDSCFPAFLSCCQELTLTVLSAAYKTKMELVVLLHKVTNKFNTRAGVNPEERK